MRRDLEKWYRVALSGANISTCHLGLLKKDHVHANILLLWNISIYMCILQYFVLNEKKYIYVYSKYSKCVDTFELSNIRSNSLST